MTDPIKSDIQKLTPGTLVEMYEFDLSMLNSLSTGSPGPVLRMHAGVNELGTDLQWLGNAYTRFPLQGTGFSWTGTGTSPRPTLSISNVLGGISALNMDYDNLSGAKVTRKRTFVQYLDGANFVGGVNPSGVGWVGGVPVAFPDDVYYVDRKAAENKQFVQYELASAADAAGAWLPRRQVAQNICTWKYRGTECGWSGANYTTNDVAGTPDMCSKKLSGCKARFGLTAPLPYGGFPGAGRT